LPYIRIGKVFAGPERAQPRGQCFEYLGQSWGTRCGWRRQIKASRPAELIERAFRI
jgi:hypothetical protein